MKALYIQANDFERLAAAFQRLKLEEKVQSVLFFMANKDQFSAAVLTPLLKDFPKKIIGGIFPELIFEGERKPSGVLLICLEQTLNCHRFNLGENRARFFSILEERFSDFGADASSLFIFCDVLGKYNTLFLESLYNFFGINLRYLGGLAGSEEFKAFPCILDNEGLHENAAVIGLSTVRMQLGAAHGWSAISEPLKVTASSDNRIKTLNWEPAFSLYQKIIKEQEKRPVQADRLWEVAQFHPLGIARMDEERILRDLVRIEGTDILLVNPIHQGEHVCVMSANKEDLLIGAKKAYDLSSKKKESTEVFCVNCISRVSFLQKDFAKELEIIKTKGRVNGILSMGEIASRGYAMPEIFNKTIVVAQW
ncbi:MAG: FIST N-terminal domain-containing protein [Bacteroidota bacterium]